MMGGETPETCWATYKGQVVNLWNCCILLVELFESYDDARTCERQIFQISGFGFVNKPLSEFLFTITVQQFILTYRIEI